MPPSKNSNGSNTYPTLVSTKDPSSYSFQLHKLLTIDTFLYCAPHKTGIGKLNELLNDVEPTFLDLPSNCRRSFIRIAREMLLPILTLDHLM